MFVLTSSYLSASEILFSWVLSKAGTAILQKLSPSSLWSPFFLQNDFFVKAFDFFSRTCC